jgi:hypothetical protein
VFDSWCLKTAGIDPLDLPFDRYLSMVHRFVMEHMKDEEAYEQFDRLLNEPPPLPEGADPDDYTEGVWSAESEMAQFQSLMG